MRDLGVRVGHWTGERTGCTVLLFERAALASGEVRGGAPATREIELLDPIRSNAGIDAVLLTGGSAFGLAAADGVMRWLAERGRGVGTPGGVVPIVPALGLYDLDGSEIVPEAAHGYAACEVASGDTPLDGAVGAGRGATVGQWRGVTLPSGLASATLRSGELVVSVVAAVNAFGEPGPLDRARLRPEGFPVAFGRNTTIGVVATNARLDKVECKLLAEGAHDGLARAVSPVHTRMDGDAFIAAATGTVEASADVARALALEAVADAIGAMRLPILRGALGGRAVAGPPRLDQAVAAEPWTSRTDLAAACALRRRRLLGFVTTVQLDGAGRPRELLSVSQSIHSVDFGGPQGRDMRRRF
ncbi:P1 family peptidase [Glycomyces sp. L485]|uniref:P1 family peptidase n=1 Tax=Glycomyces sp. L485 TaxID=2909235 RepID=UPI001F4B0F95|nr:P1 family peptidase [Glycomyces sp. L485]MCH7229454.1 P1 family peptidase [Glycomyces sp. L485]